MKKKSEVFESEDDKLRGETHENDGWNWKTTADRK